MSQHKPVNNEHRFFLLLAFLISAGIGLVSFLAARASLYLDSQPVRLLPIGISGGLILAILLLSHRRAWPRIIFIVFVFQVSANTLGGYPFVIGLVIAIVNCAEAFFAANLLERFVNSYQLFSRASHSIWFFLYVILSVVGATCFGAAAASQLFGVNFWRLWFSWCLADSLGMVLITPLILSWMPAYQDVVLDGRWFGWKTLEGVVLLACVMIALAVLFLSGQPILGEPDLSAYLIFPFLIWAGLRFNQRFITTLLGLTCLVGLFNALNGLSQFAETAQSLEMHLVGMQIYLIVLVLTSFTLRAMFKEFKQTENLLLKSEAKYHDLFDNASIGIFHSLPGGGFLIVNTALAAMLRYNGPQELVSTITDIPSQLYVDTFNYGDVLRSTLDRENWFHAVNHYRRKDGSLMVGKLSVRQVLAPDGSLVYLEGFVEDITGRKFAEDALKQSETLLNESQAIAKVGGWEYDCETKKVTWTREIYHIYGVSYDFIPDDIVQDTSFYAPEDQETMGRAFSLAVNEGKSYDLELSIQNAQGVKLWVRTHGKPVFEGGSVIKVTGTIMDISERKLAEMALEKSEEQLRLAMDASNDGLWDQNFLDNYTYFSPGYCRMLGYDLAEIPSNIDGWLGLVHPDDLERVRAINQDCRENRIPGFEIEMRMRARGSGWKWILSRGRPVQWDENGKPIRIIGTHVDITERKEAEQALRRANRKLEKQAVANEAMQALLIELATHDSLTGLYNRRFMNDALQRELSRANREENSVSVLMLDIDHFKNLNDTYGHESGDLVLVALSNLLRQSIRDSDIACRYGGEEFIIILPGANISDAKRRAEILCYEFSLVRVGPASLTSTISIGLAVYPQNGDSVDRLLHAADHALYAAKTSGRNCVRVHTG